MKLETQLFEECQSRSIHCGLSWQRITDYSVEIYTGYKKTYKNIFYTDGHTNKEEAIKKALKFLRTANNNR